MPRWWSAAFQKTSLQGQRSLSLPKKSQHLHLHLNQTPPPHLAGLPGLADGVDGMRFITAAVRSAAADGAWVPLKEVSE